MTRNAGLKKQIRRRMKEKGEKYTVARRHVLAEAERGWEREVEREGSDEDVSR